MNLGFVLGDRADVISVLDELICDLEACGGWDQFVFSRLIYDRGRARRATRAHATDDGPVANLCSNLDVRVGDASTVLGETGDAYAVVHQYDRYDAVASAVAARYPYVGGRR